VNLKAALQGSTIELSFLVRIGFSSDSDLKAGNESSWLGCHDCLEESKYLF